MRGPVVEGRAIHALAHPDPDARRYRSERTLRDGDPIDTPDGTPLAVGDVLPPR